jgi:hypothetical protein
MLEDLNKGFDRLSGLDNCVQAICLLSFFCQLRSGEVLPPTQRSQAFLEYWRCLDYLGAIHIDMLPLRPIARPHQTHVRSTPRA